MYLASLKVEINKKAFQWAAYYPLLPTIRASITIKYQQVDPELNKFKQISSNGPQVSLVRLIGLGVPIE